MRLVLSSGLTLALFGAVYLFASWSSWRRGYRLGYRLGRAQASTEEAEKAIAWHKRLAHPSRWAVNRNGEVLDIAEVKERASR